MLFGFAYKLQMAVMQIPHSGNEANGFTRLTPVFAGVAQFCNGSKVFHDYSKLCAAEGNAPD